MYKNKTWTFTSFHFIAERPHKCPYENCTVSYAESRNLKRHILSHQKGNVDSSGETKVKNSRRPATKHLIAQFPSQDDDIYYDYEEEVEDDSVTY